MTASTQVRVFHGPLPPPAVLRGYAELMPGAAERVFRLADRDQAFQHESMTRILNEQTKSRARGQGAALLVVLTALAASVWLARLGHPWPAAVIGGFALPSLWPSSSSAGDGFRSGG